MRISLSIFLFTCLFLLGSCHPATHDGNKILVNTDHSLAKLIDSLKISVKDIYILIDKSDYTLSVIAADQRIKDYPVVFGPNPTDDKRMEGDKCTPEGTFHIVSKYPHKSWNKFLWLNYPTSESWAKHRKAKQEGSIPSDAKIGGEIGIHGVPAGMDALIDAGRNWTLGCISLKNKDVDEIYPYITEQTDIIIRK